jgi:hypothetical protein
VAGGIKVALITTAAGLIIAIPVNVALTFRQARASTAHPQDGSGIVQVLNLVGTRRPPAAQWRRGRPSPDARPSTAEPPP